MTLLCWYTVNNNNNNNKTIQPDRLKTTLTEVADRENISENGFKYFNYLKHFFFSAVISPRSGRGSTVVKGLLVEPAALRLTREFSVCMCVFCCRSQGWFKKESSQVFTFNMIGASCATLHSNQETLWHFNSQGNEWKSTPVKLFLILFFLSDDINPIQSTIKLIECVTLCYSCPIKAKWIHKALFQQIRVISFFYLTYVMTYKIKRKYIYVFQLMSPFFTMYKILWVCACVCVMNYQCQSIWCNALYTSWKKRPTDLSQEFTKFSPLSPRRY